MNDIAETAEQGSSPVVSARAILGDDVVDKVKATAPVLAEHGETITGLFYQKMFVAHPELKNIFNMSNQQSGQQRHALAASVYGFASHLDNLSSFASEIERISHKHASLDIQPEHYPIVGKYLLEAVHEVVSGLLGNEAADGVVDVWGKAYGVLADLLMKKEEIFYSETEKQPGGWRGTRPFVLVERKQESQSVVSFIFKPVDGKPLIPYKAGQFIAISVQPDTSDYIEIRQYSLSDAWVDGQLYYRISVKREEGDTGKPAGLVSNYLHDHLKVGDKVEIAAPRGEFVLKEDNNKPVVLLSGGVGITPTYSMLKTLVNQQHNNQLIFVHGTENSHQHVFKHELKDLQKNNQLDNLIFYNQPLQTDKANEDYHYEGFVDLEKVKDKIKLDNADYYLCGPLAFMQKMNQQLIDLGVQETSIHYEIFGPSRRLSA